MPNRLLFRLAGPLASWGDVTVGEIRSSWQEPSKSAVLGLVAAALGIERHEEEKHSALHGALSFAVRVDAWLYDGHKKRPQPAIPLREFQTTQVPGSERKTHWPTRADELDRPSHELNTILSQRWHWQDMVATICLTARPGRDTDLEGIKDALEKPKFPLFLGRKACPVGRPLAPWLDNHPTLGAAFEAYDLIDAKKWKETSHKVLHHAEEKIWHDNDETGLNVAHTRTRRDTTRSRNNWTFADRLEAMSRFEPSTNAGATP